jgi:hypothetical protein
MAEPSGSGRSPDFRLLPLARQGMQRQEQLLELLPQANLQLKAADQPSTSLQRASRRPLSPVLLALAMQPAPSRVKARRLLEQADSTPLFLVQRVRQRDRRLRSATQTALGLAP